ncbi:hypothetical protein YB2330_001364 [Saitoella coloradoensis]
METDSKITRRPGRAGDAADDERLRALGFEPELERNFSFLSMIGFAFAILNSWTALAASLNIALPSGGPVAIIWGLLVAGVCNLALSASLAEICSVYPTSGGVYHFTAMLSTPRWSPVLSWICGWINTAGWWALTATGGALGGQLITGVIALLHPNYTVQRWHIFLIYVAYVIGAFFINAFLVRFLPAINKAALLWSISGVVIITVTVLATASPNYQSGDFVFRTYINETGWNNGVAWILGLLQAGLGLTGYDAVSHMVEEIHDPSRNAPKAMVLAVVIGLVTGLMFLIALLFALTDVDAVISGTAGPLLSIFYQATNNKAGAICLDMFPIVCMAFATTGILTTSSRMTYAFARDGGLPFSRFFSRVQKKHDVPMNALILSTIIVIIFGCIYLGSSSALNAILSASVVALGVSYGIPVAILVIRGRHILQADRSFKLGSVLGFTANLIGLAWVILTTIFFLFPPDTPVTAENMNYTIAAFAVVFIVAAITWVVKGRKHYKGPQLQHIHGTEVEGVEMDVQRVSTKGSPKRTKT